MCTNFQIVSYRCGMRNRSRRRLTRSATEFIRAVTIIFVSKVEKKESGVEITRRRLKWSGGGGFHVGSNQISNQTEK